ncbi:hypothetical protein NMG60_11020506 [Bertholletia excelsa]
MKKQKDIQALLSVARLLRPQPYRRIDVLYREEFKG